VTQPDPPLAWNWQLNASARKLAAAADRHEQAAQAWQLTVQAARTAGVPERLIESAALAADVPLPDQ